MELPRMISLHQRATLSTLLGLKCVRNQQRGWFDMSAEPHPRCSHDEHRQPRRMNAGRLLELAHSQFFQAIHYSVGTIRLRLSNETMNREL